MKSCLLDRYLMVTVLTPFSLPLNAKLSFVELIVLNVFDISYCYFIN